MFIEKPGFLDSYSGFQNLMMLASIKGPNQWGRGERCFKESGAAGCNVQKISEIFSWNETETRGLQLQSWKNQN